MVVTLRSLTMHREIGSNASQGELVGELGALDSEAADVFLVEVEVQAELLVLVP